MMDQRCKRWTNITLTLGQRLVLDGRQNCEKAWFDPSKHETLNQWLCNVGTPSATLAQHYTTIGSMPRVCCISRRTCTGALLNFGLMLDQCNAGPALNQYWVYLSCLPVNIPSNTLV